MLQQIEERNIESDVYFIKLYHPTRLRGLVHYTQVICISLLTLITLWYIHLLFKTDSYFIKVNLILLSVYLPFLLVYITYNTGTTYVESIFLSFRQMLISQSAHNDVYMTIPESCCTPAVLFVDKHLNKITNHLSSVISKTGVAKDHLLDDFYSFRKGFHSLMTYTDLVEHIGAISFVHKWKIFLFHKLWIVNGNCL